MAGGVALRLGNLVAQYAWAFAGLSVTNIICASLTVSTTSSLQLSSVHISGTTMNCFLDGRINRAEILFPGVACFLVAVFLGDAVHPSNAKDDQEKLNMPGCHICTMKKKSGGVVVSSSVAIGKRLLQHKEVKKNLGYIFIMESPKTMTMRMTNLHMRQDLALQSSSFRSSRDGQSRLCPLINIENFSSSRSRTDTLRL
ncbi:hypothetical protein EJB05_26447, partial [Eragrostis curvula]